MAQMNEEHHMQSAMLAFYEINFAFPKSSSDLAIFQVLLFMYFAMDFTAWWLKHKDKHNKQSFALAWLIFQLVNLLFFQNQALNLAFIWDRVFKILRLSH